MSGQKQYAEVDNAILIPANDPMVSGIAMFKKCGVKRCGRPAVFIMLGRVNLERYRNVEYTDDAVADVCDELRHMFNTNFEFPVCECHTNGDAPN